MLQRIIDAPRQYVTTQTYFGPCRSRSKAGPPNGLERRKPDESHATIVYSKDKVEKPAAPSDVWLFKLPNYLKQKMGSNAMRQPFVLPDDVLFSAEQQLKREADGFLDWAKGYLDRLSRQVTEAKQVSGDPLMNTTWIENPLYLQDVQTTGQGRDDYGKDGDDSPHEGDNPPEIKPPLPQEVPAPRPSQPEIVPVEAPPPMDPGLPSPET